MKKNIVFLSLLSTICIAGCATKNNVDINENYYNDTPYYKNATLSLEKENEIENDIKEKEDRERISKNYKQIIKDKEEKARQEAEKKAKEEKIIAEQKEQEEQIKKEQERIKENIENIKKI